MLACRGAVAGQVAVLSCWHAADLVVHAALVPPVTKQMCRLSSSLVLSSAQSLLFPVGLAFSSRGLVSVGFFGVVGEDLVGFGQQEWGAGFSCACNARDCVRGAGEWVG